MTVPNSPKSQKGPWPKIILPESYGSVSGYEWKKRKKVILSYKKCNTKDFNSLLTTPIPLGKKEGISYVEKNNNTALLRILEGGVKESRRLLWKRTPIDKFKYNDIFLLVP